MSVKIPKVLSASIPLTHEEKIELDVAVAKLQTSKGKFIADAIRHYIRVSTQNVPQN